MWAFTGGLYVVGFVPRYRIPGYLQWLAWKHWFRKRLGCVFFVDSKGSSPGSIFHSISRSTASIPRFLESQELAMPWLGTTRLLPGNRAYPPPAPPPPPALPALHRPPPSPPPPPPACFHGLFWESRTGCNFEMHRPPKGAILEHRRPFWLIWLEK